MAFTKKIKAGTVPVNTEEFIGTPGTIFYDPDVGDFYLSDGVTPGGVSIGTQGQTGPVGPQGPQGVQGIQGVQGNVGLGFTIAKTYSSVSTLTADTTPTGIVSGQFALVDTGSVEDAETGRLYLWNGTVYSYVIDLSGAQGIKGETGSTGPQGIQGANGTNGYTGSKGDDGSAGATGAGGIQGTTGYTGSAGTDGINGATGSTGPAGSNGSAGATGLTGYTGSAGTNGSNGVTGYTGSIGSNVDIGNWGFRNNTIYNLLGGEINNADTISGATAGLVLPGNGNVEVITALFNTYGNIQIQVANLATSATTSIWQFNEDGNLTLPQTNMNASPAPVSLPGITFTDGTFQTTAYTGVGNQIDNTDGNNTWAVSVANTGVISMTTGRGGIEFGAMPEIGGPTHLHIMRPAGAEGATDLFFGDDYNYVKLPGLYGNGTQGVEIGSSFNSGTVSSWRFDTDGTLTLPDTGKIAAGVDVPQVGSTRTITTDSNDGTGAGTPGVVDVAYDNTIIPTYYYPGGGAPNFTDSTITFQNGDVRTITSIVSMGGYIDITYSGTTTSSPEFPIILKTGNYAAATTAPKWTFGTNGNLTLPGSGSIDGSDFDVDIVAGNDGASTYGHISFTANGPIGLNSLTFNSLGEVTVSTAGANDGLIKWVGNSSADSAGYTTMVLVPDTTVEGNDQYLVVDPTGPNHIHLRAGGVIDNSNAELYIGGEASHLRLGSGLNPNVYISSNNQNWTFATDGILTLPSGNTAIGNTLGSDVIISAPNTAFGVISQGNTGFGSLQWLDSIVEPLNVAGIAVNSPYAASTGSVQIYTGIVGIPFQNAWTFDPTGNLTLPQTNMNASPAPTSLPGITWSDGTFQSGKTINVPEDQSMKLEFTSMMYGSSNLQIRNNGIKTSTQNISLETGNNSYFGLEGTYKQITFSESYGSIVFGTETRNQTGHFNDIEIKSYSDGTNGNVYISAGGSPTGNRWTFQPDGAIKFPDGTYQSTASIAGATGPQGNVGATGPTGLGFTIAKTYANVAALTADTSPTSITSGQFAIIDTGNVNDAENAKLYLWNGSAYNYVTDLSGSAGITGAAGATGVTGYTGSQGTIGATGPQGNVGTAGASGPGFVWRGAWQSAPTTYIGGQDVVSYGGGSYIKIGDGNSGSYPPDDPVRWSPVAESGATGIQGNVGYTGSVGSFTGTTGSQINTSNTTVSTSTTTGALVVAGGAGIAGAVNIGTSLTVDNGTYGNVVATQFGSLFATAYGPNNFALLQSWSPATGGGLGLNAFGNIVYSAGAINFKTGATIRDKDYPTGGTNGVQIASNGAIIASTGIASNSTSTGAVIVTGGVGISGNVFAGGSVTATAATATVTSTAASIGYMGVPQNAQTGSYTLVIGDAGKQILMKASGNLTIPSNVTVPFPIGTTIDILSYGGTTTAIRATTDVIVVAGVGEPAQPRILSGFGWATLIKVENNAWWIRGEGLS